MRGGTNLGDAVETLHVAVVDAEVKVSLGGGGEGGMPHHLTVQFAVGVHHTWEGGVGVGRRERGANKDAAVPILGLSTLLVLVTYE